MLFIPRNRKKGNTMTSNFKGKRKRPNTEVDSDTESVGSNFQAPQLAAPQLAGKMEREQPDDAQAPLLSRSMVLSYKQDRRLKNVGLPPEFKKNILWPTWKDFIFMREMYNAKYKFQSYRMLADRCDYSWDMHELWETIAENVEESSRTVYHDLTTPMVDNEKILSTSTDQVKERARIYIKYHHKILSNESCMMQTMEDTVDFKNYVRAVFTTKKSDALPPCLNVPYNRKSNNSLGSLGRRSRGKSIASSSRNVGSEVVVGELGNNQSIIPQSKHFRDAHNHSEAISSDLKRLLPMMGINMEACCPVSCYVTNSDTRVSLFVNGDDEEKMAMIHLAVRKMQKYSRTQYALDNTARQLLLGDTQEMEQ